MAYDSTVRRGSLLAISLGLATACGSTTDGVTDDGGVAHADTNVADSGTLSEDSGHPSSDVGGPLDSGVVPADTGPVGACNSLPAAGTWESIAPSGVTDTDAVIVDPFDPAVVWLGANGKGIFRSPDCGATWVHVNTGRNAVDVDKGGKVSMAVDPVDRGTMYTVSLYGTQGLWKTTNGGVDWDQIWTSKVVQYNFIDSISMDPNDHRHLVVGTHAECVPPHPKSCQAESTDAGATWTIVDLPNDYWEEQSGPFVLDATSWVYGAPSGLYLTIDHGKTFRNVAPKGAAFGGGEVETHPIFRGPDGTYYLTSYIGIARSTDKLGREWEIIPDSGGRTVGLTMGDGKLFSSDQWSDAYHVASLTAPTVWKKLPAPPAPGNTGAPYVAYDEVHHVLYSSNFKGGVWRMVPPP